MMGTRLARVAASAVLTILAGAIACNDDVSTPDEARTFVVEVSGERFKVRAIEAADIAALEQRMQNGETGVISGRLVAGDGGFNAPWSWHLDPTSLEVPDLSTEVCDGRPSFVEEDLDYWLDDVKIYCPWGAKVVEATN